MVTNVAGGGKVNFANSDPLGINQPSAAFGNIASLANPPPPTGDLSDNLFLPDSGAHLLH